MCRNVQRSAKSDGLFLKLGGIMPWYEIAALLLAVPGAAVGALIIYDRFRKPKP